MRRRLAASLLATLLLAPAPAAAIKKTPYPEVRVALPPAVPVEPALVAMRKELAAAISRRNAGLLYELVGPTFFWNTNGEPSPQFDGHRDALHNFKVAFGFRTYGSDSDSRNPEGQLWEVLEEAGNGAALFAMEGNAGVLCGPATADIVDDEAMDRALATVETGDEDSEWVYSIGAITLTEKPSGGGAVETVAGLAMPIVATHPPTQALGNNPLPTHDQLLLPSGKTGWVEVKSVQPLAVDKLCYGKGPDGAWKIVGYEQNS
jgi:hypothetical protein